MLALPRDMQLYCLAYLNFRDYQALEMVSRGFKKMVTNPLNKLRIELVLANPARMHHIPPGELKNICWSAVVEQEQRLLKPYLKPHEFEFACPGLIRNGNVCMIALAGKVHFLVACNLFALTFPKLTYKVEYSGELLKISDSMPSGSIFETYQTTQVYNGINSNGLIIGNHHNHDNWKTHFDFLGKSLFGKEYFLKIIPGEQKRIFIIQSHEGIIQQVFTSVYESNQLFHIAPLCRSFRGSVVGIEIKKIGLEKPEGCFIVEHEGAHYWVFVKESKVHFRTHFEVKAVLSRSASC